MTCGDRHKSNGRIITLRPRHVVFVLVVIAAGLGGFIAGGVNNSHPILIARQKPPTPTRAALPKVNPSMVNYPPTYKPRKFLLSVDGAIYMSGITWKSWTAHTALGRGTLHEDSCIPNCFHGSWTIRTSDIVLGKPIETRHGLLFTSVSIAALGSGIIELPMAHNSTGKSTSIRTTQAPNEATSLNGYLASLNNSAIFLQWTQQGGSVNGSVQVAYLPANGIQVTSEHETVSGTVDGSSLTLSIEPDGLYGTTNLSGSMLGSGFLLSIPGSNGSLVPVQFVSATAADYDSAVAILQAKATRMEEQQQAAAAR